MTGTEKQAQQQAAQEQSRQEESGALVLCKQCGTELEEGALFCPQCGGKIDGEERVCQFCQTVNTSEFCTHCGRRVVPFICPKCGNATVFDFCGECGIALNPEMEAFFTAETSEPKIMTEEETQEVARDFDESMQKTESPEFRAFIQKMEERQVLLEERDYFNKREKRIIKVFGARPFEVELPDPQEEAFRMKAYAALEKTVIERQEKLKQAEWEKLFPEEKKIPVQQGSIIILKSQREIDEEKQRADLERRREEMEKKYKLLLSQVENEVEEFRIAEEKRKEEERLRLEAEKREKERLERERQKELERQRLEQQAYVNRICGTYYYGNPGRDYESIEICITDNMKAYCKHHCNGHGDSFGDFTVSFDGQNVSLSPYRNMSYKECPLDHSHMHGFRGTLNNAGTVLSGYWDNNSRTHHKR